MNPPRAPRTSSTITQMCREFGVTARALRFYEEQGLLSPIGREQARVYTDRDRARLKLILKGRRAGFALRAIRELLDVYDREGEVAQRAKALPLMRAQVTRLEMQKRQIDDFITALTAASARLSQGGGAPPPHAETPQRQA